MKKNYLSSLIALIIFAISFIGCEEKVEFPGVPTGLKVEYHAEGYTIINWDLVAGAEFYELVVSYDTEDLNALEEFNWEIDESGEYVSNWDNGTEVFINATKAKDTEIVPGTDMYYRVAALNKGGAGAYSDPVMVSIPEGNGGKLDAPTGVYADYNASTSCVDIYWDEVSGANYYTVYGSENANDPDGTYIVIEENITTLEISDCFDGFADGETYYYKVTALDDTGESDFSATVSATIGGGNEAPDVPTNVTAEYEEGFGIIINWYAVNNADSYEVFYSDSEDGVYNSLGELTDTIYFDNAAEPGTWYYKVMAINQYGESDYSLVVSATIEEENNLPGVPANVYAYYGEGYGIEISWEAVTNADNYEVFYSTSENGDYTSLTIITEPIAYDAAVSSGETWYYKVKAINQYGESDYSLVVSATVPESGSGMCTIYFAREQGLTRLTHMEITDINDYNIIIADYNFDQGDISPAYEVDANDYQSWAIVDGEYKVITASYSFLEDKTYIIEAWENESNVVVYDIYEDTPKGKFLVANFVGKENSKRLRKSN